MCDGFSEAFMASAAAASEAGGAAAAVESGTLAAGMSSSAVAAGGAAEASTLATVGAYAGTAAGTVGTGGALSLASAGLSAANQYQQSNAAQEAATFQSGVDANNAKLALVSRSSTLQAGAAAAMQSETQAAQVFGAQRAALASNGVTLGSGSAVDLLATTRFLNQADVNTIQSNAAKSAWGYSVNAQSSQASSELASWQAKNNSPGLAAGLTGSTSLLTSASRYALGNKGNLMFANS